MGFTAGAGPCAAAVDVAPRFIDEAASKAPLGWCCRCGERKRGAMLASNKVNLAAEAYSHKLRADEETEEEAHDQQAATLRWARIGGPDFGRQCWGGSPAESLG